MSELPNAQINEWEMDRLRTALGRVRAEAKQKRAMSMCPRCGAISDDPENHWCADYQHAIDKATRNLRAEHRDEIARLTAERDRLATRVEQLERVRNLAARLIVNEITAHELHMAIREATDAK